MIEDRPGTYNPDKVWDETSGLWVDNDGRGGGKYQKQLIVVSDQGVIYFGDV